MYSSEAKFSQGLCRKLKNWADATRIESHITPGVPDIYLQFKEGDIWIELKNYKCSYAEWSGVVAWRPGQQAWAMQYRHFHDNRCVVTLIAFSDGYYFVPMTYRFSDCKVIKNDFYFIPKKEWSKLTAQRVIELLYAASTTPITDINETARCNIYKYISKILCLYNILDIPEDFDLDVFTTEYQEFDPDFKPEILDANDPEHVFEITYTFLKAMKFEILRTAFTMEDNNKEAL